MFELFRAYELAKNEKNKYIRFFCINYTKYKLKRVFFSKYKKLIINGHMRLSVDLLNEFNQFYECTYNHTAIRLCHPHIYKLTNNNVLQVFFYNKLIGVRVNTDHSIVGTISSKDDVHEVFDLEDNSVNHYTYLVSDMVTRAMYNYCVSYIYGSRSSLYLT